MNHLRRLALLLLLLLPCCSEHSTQTPSTDPYTRWRARNLHEYTIDQIQSCYCPNGGQLMRVTVRADTIAQVLKLSDSSIVPRPMSEGYLTVDSLFAIIRNPGKDSLVVKYDPQYGYPSFLDINPQQHPYDGGVLYETSNLRIP